MALFAIGLVVLRDCMQIGKGRHLLLAIEVYSRLLAVRVALRLEHGLFFAVCLCGVGDLADAVAKLVVLVQVFVSAWFVLHLNFGS